MRQTSHQTGEDWSFRIFDEIEFCIWVCSSNKQTSVWWEEKKIPIPILHFWFLLLGNIKMLCPVKLSEM